MKKYTFLSILLLAVLQFNITLLAQTDAVSGATIGDTITMGNGYANDVFYSLENREVAQANRTDWDIAFATNQMSVSILTNGGSGVVLYSYPNSGIEGWNSMDTTGIHDWKPLYNSEQDWEIGAFNANSTGSQFDYGWGVYDVTTHNITGDSLFFVKLTDGSYRKIWIVMKNAIANTYTFKYAQIDGSQEQEMMMSGNDFVGRKYGYFSFATELFINREPVLDWDLLFTKYAAAIPMGPQMVYYPVTGVLTKAEIQVAEVRDVNKYSYESWFEHDFSSSISAIGYDWKTSTPPLAIKDSVVYFIKVPAGDVYKLFFTGFESGTTGAGKIGFQKQLISATGTDELISKNGLINVFPNPVKEVLQFVADLTSGRHYQLALYNRLGQICYRANLTGQGLATHRIPVSGLQNGVYFLSIDDGHRMMKTKIVIQQ